jgi:hypothetical protein
MENPVWETYELVVSWEMAVLTTDGFLAFESGGGSFGCVGHDLHSVVVPYVQKPVNTHGFERIQKFLNDSLCVGIRSFYCELAHDKHDGKFVLSVESTSGIPVEEENWGWERVDRISKPQYWRLAVMEADR